MFRSAEQRYASLKETVEGQQGELQKLQASDGWCRRWPMLLV
jgi:hypothetical protein